MRTRRRANDCREQRVSLQSRIAHAVQKTLIRKLKKKENIYTGIVKYYQKIIATGNTGTVATDRRNIKQYQIYTAVSVKIEK